MKVYFHTTLAGFSISVKEGTIWSYYERLRKDYSRSRQEIEDNIKRVRETDPDTFAMHAHLLLTHAPEYSHDGNDNGVIMGFELGDKLEPGNLQVPKIELEHLVEVHALSPYLPTVQAILLLTEKYRHIPVHQIQPKTWE